MAGDLQFPSQFSLIKCKKNTKKKEYGSILI